jgi:hypothetical protein
MSLERTLPEPASLAAPHYRTRPLSTAALARSPPARCAQASWPPRQARSDHLRTRHQYRRRSAQPRCACKLCSAACGPSGQTRRECMRLSATSALGKTVPVMVLLYFATQDCVSLLAIYAGVLIENPAGPPAGWVTWRPLRRVMGRPVPPQPRRSGTIYAARTGAITFGQRPHRTSGAVMACDRLARRHPPLPPAA